MKIEKRKTLFIMKFAIAYWPSVTIQSKKLLLCGTSKGCMLLRAKLEEISNLRLEAKIWAYLWGTKD